MGKNFSANSICNHLKKEENSKIAPETIRNYIKYLSNSNLITKVQREDIEGKKILTANEKYYITNHGFNQVYNGRNITNISRTIENIVYIELLRNRYKVFIGKLNNSEVDFIAKKGKQKIYIQVSYFLASDETVNSEFRPLLKIKDNYPKYVLSMDKFDFSHEGVIHQNIIDFLVWFKIIILNNPIYMTVQNYLD